MACLTFLQHGSLLSCRSSNPSYGHATYLLLNSVLYHSNASPGVVDIAYKESVHSMGKATCLIPSKTSKGTKVRTNTLRKNRKTDSGGVRKKMHMSVSSLVQPLSHWVKNSSTGDNCWEGWLHRATLKRMLIQHDWHLRSKCMWPSTWPFSLPSGKQAIFRTLTKQTCIKILELKDML